MPPAQVRSEHETHRPLGIENHGDALYGRLGPQNFYHGVVQNLDAWRSRFDLTG
jgi:hypothetical protein